MSWRPAWSRDLTVSSHPCPLGLRGHCRGRKEGVVDQKVQKKASGRRREWEVGGPGCSASLPTCNLWGSLNRVDYSTQVLGMPPHTPRSRATSDPNAGGSRLSLCLQSVGSWGQQGHARKQVGSLLFLQTVLGKGEVLPTTFEASEKWPNLIHEPLDQGNCAGSWAFSTAGVSRGRDWHQR